MKEFLNMLSGGVQLTREQTKNIMLNITKGEYSQVQISAFLSMIQVKGASVDELLGLRDGLLQTGLPIDLSPYKVIDIVGTGGDGKNTFNISTCSCFVVAGAGYKVAKHGNYAASSVSGASNVLEEQGAKFTNDQDKLKESLEKANFTYLHAPLFAKGMKNVAPVRKDLAIATCFNLIGPLINPCKPNYQLLGTANLNQLRLYNSIYKKIGIDYGVVSSIDGYDEVSLTSNFKIVTNNKERICSPQELGFKTINPQDILGGSTKEEAVGIFRNVLDNRSNESQKNVVLANSAFAIWVIEQEKEIEECLSIAKESLERGKAKEAFVKYLEINS